jgi:hypothetical protein
MGMREMLVLQRHNSTRLFHFLAIMRFIVRMLVSNFLIQFVIIKMNTWNKPIRVAEGNTFSS